MSFQGKEKCIDAVTFHPLHRTTNINILLKISLKQLLENVQTIIRYFKILTDQARLQCSHKEVEVNLFIYTKQGIHNKHNIVRDIFNEHQDRLILALNSLYEEMGEIFVVIQKQVERMLHR
jgi:hypothetical protein